MNVEDPFHPVSPSGIIFRPQLPELDIPRVEPLPGLLSDRLSSLCAHGILEQVQRAPRLDWAEYRLTAKGLAFFPVIATAIAWSERWLGSERGPAVNIVHRACGSAFHGVLACDQCGAVLAAAGIETGADEPPAE